VGELFSSIVDSRERWVHSIYAERNGESFDVRGAEGSGSEGVSHGGD